MPTPLSQVPPLGPAPRPTLTLAEAAKALCEPISYIERLLREGRLSVAALGPPASLSRDEVLAFQAKRDQARRAALDALEADTEREGGYEDDARWLSGPERL
jgi:hypothetical protein